MAEPAHDSAIDLLRRHAEAVSSRLAQILDGYTDDAPARLLEAIRYSLLAPGKRLRPALVLESFQAASQVTCPDPQQVSPHRLDLHSTALSSAAAIELIHTFSLVHDDLPAMDDDDLRRGRPTNHKVFGEAMAILAGDAMVAMAFEVLARGAEPRLSPRLIGELARATGPEGMIGGQVLDMDGEKHALQLPDLRRLHRKKTGALLTAACRMGAIAADAPESIISALDGYGQHLGVAFQIVDDLLDVTATPEQLGKATRKDAAAGKNTYPTLLGIEGSRREAHELLAAALSHLEPLGPAADGLRQLARFVVVRSA